MSFEIANDDFVNEDFNREEELTLGASKIFRFKFTEEFMQELYKFSKIHQYDHRKDFKEAWLIYLEENDDIIQEEVDRLNRLGYDGDILDKMFKSARYYFRKKSPVKVEPKQRRQYITVNHDLLEAMDRHIRSNICNTDYQPKNGFIMFCNDNQHLMMKTFKILLENGINEGDQIKNKFKKTYKNRYFMLTNKGN